jgi:ABC-type uncharacterized transport system permease subunit
MNEHLLLSLAALVALMPFSVVIRRVPGENLHASHWLLLLVAFAGALTYSIGTNRYGWNPGFASSLWISIAATLAGYAVLSRFSPVAWRLGPLLMPYLLILALLATIWSGTSAAAPITEIGPWLAIHLVLAITTYAAATLSAIAGISVFIQERALKRRQPGRVSRALPSVAEGERLLMRLLALAVGVLFVGIITGIAELYITQARILIFDHKTIFSVLAFAFLGVIWVLHLKSGLRGRRAARFVLSGYLLITLAFPGVKLVSDVILG